MAQGVVAYLQVFLNDLLMLHLTMEDYLEVSEPGD